MKLKNNHGEEIVTIYHTAYPLNFEEVGVRTIQTPANRCGRVRHMDEAAATAEVAFELTNHPEPPPFEQTTEGRCYSTSAGDIICVTDNVGTEYWMLCASYGFLAFGKGHLGKQHVQKHIERWGRALQVHGDYLNAIRYFPLLANRKGPTALPAAAYTYFKQL